MNLLAVRESFIVTAGERFGRNPMLRRDLLASLLTPAALLSAVPAASGRSMSETIDSAATREVTETDHRFRQAWIGPDVALLTRILADEWTVTHTNGRRQTKAQFISSLANGRVRFLLIDSDDLVVRVYGETAVLTARLRDKAVFNGQAGGGFVRVLSVYVRRDGSWRNVAEQATAIEAPPPSA